MLELIDIHTFYGPVEALKGVTMEVRQGEIVCLIGNNGAGKSTALMTISGILRPRSGDVLFEGKSIKELLPMRLSGWASARCRRAGGYSPSSPSERYSRWGRIS